MCKGESVAAEMRLVIHGETDQVSINTRDDERQILTVTERRCKHALGGSGTKSVELEVSMRTVSHMDRYRNNTGMKVCICAHTYTYIHSPQLSAEEARKQ